MFDDPPAHHPIVDEVARPEAAMDLIEEERDSASGGDLPRRISGRFRAANGAVGPGRRHRDCSGVDVIWANTYSINRVLEQQAMATCPAD